jgi:hypothetical protein
VLQLELESDVSETNNNNNNDDGARRNAVPAAQGAIDAVQVGDVLTGKVVQHGLFGLEV